MFNKKDPTLGEILKFIRHHKKLWLSSSHTRDHRSNVVVEFFRMKPQLYSVPSVLALQNSFPAAATRLECVKQLCAKV